MGGGVRAGPPPPLYPSLAVTKVTKTPNIAKMPKNCINYTNGHLASFTQAVTHKISNCHVDDGQIKAPTASVWVQFLPFPSRLLVLGGEEGPNPVVVGQGLPRCFHVLSAVLMVVLPPPTWQATRPSRGRNLPVWWRLSPQVKGQGRQPGAAGAQRPPPAMPRTAPPDHADPCWCPPPPPPAAPLHTGQRAAPDGTPPPERRVGGGGAFGRGTSESFHAATEGTGEGQMMWAGDLAAGECCAGDRDIAPDCHREHGVDRPVEGQGICEGGVHTSMSTSTGC